MKLINTFFFHIAQGIKGIFRNPIMSTASLLVLVCCMVVTGTFALIIDNINKNFEALDDVNKMIVWLDDAPKAEEGKESAEESKEENEYNLHEYDKKTEDAIKALEHVVDVVFMSKQEAFEEFKQSEGSDAEFLDWFDAEENNPLRASYRITFASDTDTENIRYIKKAIAEMGFNEENIDENIDLYDNLINVKGALTTIALWLLAVLFVISLFIIMNSTRLGLHSRREEIQIMRYVGATNSFVRAPFVIEGVVIGLVSAAIALGIEYYLYTQVISGVIRQYEAIVIAPFTDYLLVLSIAFAAIGVFAGLFGSVISIRKYLKV
ncbi:MAG: ABC transporter permease [Clostridia bacterium]|nr:ABC transporter permease [Clostridia bacterium]